MDTLLQLLAKAALAGTFIVGLLGLVLMVSPASLLKGRGTPGKQKPAIPGIRIERFVYRHHRLFGTGIALSAIYTLLALLTQPAPLAVAPDSVTHWLLQATDLFLIISNVLFVPFGAVVFLRPSLLKGFEGWANSLARVPNVGDNSLPLPEKGSILHRHPRWIGLATLAASLYLAAMLLFHFN